MVIAPGKRPASIPNLEAKPGSADGTATDGLWESRTPPQHTHRSGQRLIQSLAASLPCRMLSLPCRMLSLLMSLSTALATRTSLKRPRHGGQHPWADKRTQQFDPRASQPNLHRRWLPTRTPPQPLCVPQTLPRATVRTRIVLGPDWAVLGRLRSKQQRSTQQAATQHAATQQALRAQARCPQVW